MDELLSLNVDAPSWRMVLGSLLVAYVLSQAIAGVYAYTHRGLSYSRSFVIALVASGVLAAVLMLTIGGSLARGIGIVGTLALVRFRTNLHDPLDIVFVLAAFTAGVAAGTGNYAIGTLGTLAFLLIAGLLRMSDFGSQRRFDGVLRVQLPSTTDDERSLSDVLSKHCKSFLLVTLRQMMQGRQLERVYQLTLRDAQGEASLVSAVTAVPGATGVSLAMQEATVEL